jgi:glycine cleavage system H protein
MGHTTPEHLKYTKEHEWTEIENDIATIGVTDFAQSTLGDIVFVEFPEVGTQIKKDESFGVVESIKSVSDLFAPLSGEVLEVNDKLEENPELINEEPYDSWMIKVKLSIPEETENLLNSTSYQSYCDKNS